MFGAVQVGWLKPTPSPVGLGTSGEVSVKVNGFCVPFAGLNVPDEGLGVPKLTNVNTPSRIAKQKSAQATAARKIKRPERELVVFRIGVERLHGGQRDVPYSCQLS